MYGPRGILQQLAIIVFAYAGACAYIPCSAANEEQRTHEQRDDLLAVFVIPAKTGI
jgi:hypothetical protein